jgi:hypothetical protein
MRTLLVQFLPDRCPQLEVGLVLALLAQIVAADPRVRHFEVSKHNARGPFVNISFASHDRELPHLWSLVQRQALMHRLLGAKLQRSCVVTCEGSRGWNNCLLLHHFSPEVPLDVLRPV